MLQRSVLLEPLPAAVHPRPAALLPSPSPHLTSTFHISTSSSMAKAQLSSRDLESAIFALRANGFDLFANSIAVSDLSLQVLTHSFNSSTTSTSVGRHGYTFLAPPNSVLFSLDMSTDAFTYVHSLRFHVIPRRLSFADLRNVSLSSKPHLETLVRGHDLFVSSSNSSSSFGRRRRVVVSIDGVRVSFPEIYLSSNIAVHGLDGILVSSSNEEFFHRLDSVASPPPPIEPPTLPPSIDAFSPRIEPVSAPIDAFSPNIVGIPPFSAEFEGIPPYPPEFGVIPPFLDDFEGIPEDLSPISAFPPEFGAIPPSHDAAFDGGSFDRTSIPPIHADSPKSDGIPAISPYIGRIPAISPEIGRIPATSPSTEFLSPNVADSIAPTHAEWSGAESWLPDWNALPPRFPVEEWQEYWDNIDHKKTKKKMIMKSKEEASSSKRTWIW